MEPHEIVAAAVGTTTLCGIAYRCLVTPIVSYAKASLAAHEAVVREFRPNGGSTMRDAINDIRCRVHRLAQVDHITLEMTDKAYFETDGNGLCVWANNAYLALTHSQKHELLGLGWVNAIHPHDRRAVRAEWNSCIADRRNFQMRFRTAHGDQCILSIGMMIFNADSEVIGAIGSWSPLPCEDCLSQWRDDLCKT